MHNVKEGNTRTVIIRDNSVIKIAKNHFGLKSNMKEYQTWESTHNEHLAKIIDHSNDFYYIEMEKIVIPSLLKRIKISKRLKRLNELGINDILWYNVGQRKDGTPVIFDYGGAIISWSGFLHRIKRVLGVVG